MRFDTRNAALGLSASLLVFASLNLAAGLSTSSCYDCFFPHGLPFTLFREGGFAGGGGVVWTGLALDFGAAIVCGIALAWVLGWLGRREVRSDSGYRRPRAVTLAALVVILPVAVALANAGTLREQRSLAMAHAAWDGQLWKVRLCYRIGANVNEDVPGRGPHLISAAWNGHTEIVRFLLDRGTLIDGGNKYGWTALMAAAYGGHVETVRYLISRGANINATGWDGSALRLAREHRRAAVEKLLMDHGAVDRYH